MLDISSERIYSWQRNNRGCDNATMMPMPIDESADAAGSFLHAKPSVIGQVAAAVNPKALVLSHFLGKGLVLKDESTKIVQKYYKGPVYEGRDLACFPVDGVK